jgi:hypothetical protein
MATLERAGRAGLVVLIGAHEAHEAAGERGLAEPGNGGLDEAAHRKLELDLVEAHVDGHRAEHATAQPVLGLERELGDGDLFGLGQMADAVDQHVHLLQLEGEAHCSDPDGREAAQAASWLAKSA